MRVVKGQTLDGVLLIHRRRGQARALGQSNKHSKLPASHLNFGTRVRALEQPTSEVLLVSSDQIFHMDFWNPQKTVKKLLLRSPQ
jgi:hypothetical protein